MFAVLAVLGFFCCLCARQDTRGLLHSICYSASGILLILRPVSLPSLHPSRSVQILPWLSLPIGLGSAAAFRYESLSSSTGSCCFGRVLPAGAGYTRYFLVWCYDKTVIRYQKTTKIRSLKLIITCFELLKSEYFLGSFK